MSVLLPVPENTIRQAIDASVVWSEYLATRSAAAPYLGGMYWKKEGGYEYLVKTLPRKKQERLGVRSPQTENTYRSFHEGKRATEGRLAALSEALDEAQRQNKALRAGRTPDIVVKLLNALREAGLEQHFRVVGTHALYAYEAAAGVRIVRGAMAINDVDLFGDTRTRVQFAIDLKLDANSILEALKRADPSFQRLDHALKNQSAVNDKGFKVEFLRYEQNTEDMRPSRFSGADEGVWPEQARSASLLAQSTLFSQTVISATGKMATLNTVDPETFVAFKRLLAGPEGRDAARPNRDALQAAVVQQMLDERQLVLRHNIRGC